MPIENPTKSQLIVPNEVLRPYISGYQLTSTNVATTPKLLDLFPVGHAVLSFALEDYPVVLDGSHPVESKWNLTGQLTHHHTISVGPTHSYVCVLFKPTGAFRFFGEMERIENSLQDVCQLLNDDPSTEKAYKEMVDAGKKSSLVIRLMERWLKDRLQHRFDEYAWELASAGCTFISQSNGSMPITALCEKLYISKTKLERVFQSVIGISPKRYSHIMRFNHAYQFIKSSTHAEWDEITSRYAYFDQTHFIREFKIFCGHTPAQLHQNTLNAATQVVEKRKYQQSR